MRSLQELTQTAQPRIKELSRKDSVRRACVKEITHRLNLERSRDNESKVQRHMWTNQVSRTEALKALRKHPDKRERVWAPYTERAIHFKTVKLDERDLRDLLDRCNAAEKDKGSFGKLFNGILKTK